MSERERTRAQRYVKNIAPCPRACLLEYICADDVVLACRDKDWTEEQTQAMCQQVEGARAKASVCERQMREEKEEEEPPPPSLLLCAHE